jgi:O-antigen/teichoic acid export membrane protein
MGTSQLRKHFFYKLITNFIRIPISFILQSIFPRILGPVAYGNFDFLVDNSNKIISFFDNGLSTAFYTRLSHKPEDLKLVKFFAWIVLFISLFYIAFVCISYISGIYLFIWPSQEFSFILLSALLGIVTFASNSILKMIDAFNLTVRGEWNRMIQLVISVVVCYFSFLVFKTLSLDQFFFLQILLIGILILGSILVLKHNAQKVIPSVVLSKADIKEYSRFFWNYSHPLLIYSFVGLFVGIGERWLLQIFGGSIQQGFFGLSFKVGAFVFLFTSAVIPLLTREFAILFGNTNLPSLQSLYIKNIKVLFFLATCLGVFSSLNANFIILILAGKGYEDAGIVVSIMAFYPIHQTLGQLNGSLFYSTNRTRDYRNIGIFFMPLSLIMSYFLIAPTKYFGLELGAEGLVYEMLIIQFLAVNVQLYSNMNFLNLKYWNIFWFQIIIIISVFTLGFVEKKALVYFIKDEVINCLVFSVFFIFSLITLVFCIPKVIGVSKRQEMYEFFKKRKLEQ